MIYPAFAAEYDQIVSTSDGTLDVGIYTIPKVPNIEEPMKLMIDFLKPGTERIQQHIDYTVGITKDGDYVFGPTMLLHTSAYTSPSVPLPVEFSENGLHLIHIEVDGIWFTVVPLETATLTINVGESTAPVPELYKPETSIPGWIKNNAGWWADGQIDDISFVSGLQWLISNGIMKIS